MFLSFQFVLLIFAFVVRPFHRLWFSPIRGRPNLRDNTNWLSAIGYRLFHSSLRREWPHHRLYGRNLPHMVTWTRSPFGSSTLLISIVKSIALMIPSPNCSWISSLIVSP